MLFIQFQIVDNKNAERDPGAKYGRSCAIHIYYAYLYLMIHSSYSHVFYKPKLFIRGLVRTQKTTLHNLKLRLFENTPFKESKKFFVQHPPNDAQGPDLHLCLFA